MGLLVDFKLGADRYCWKALGKRRNSTRAEVEADSLVSIRLRK